MTIYQKVSHITIYIHVVQFQHTVMYEAQNWAPKALRG
jgi:hypothetical protein